MRVPAAPPAGATAWLALGAAGLLLRYLSAERAVDADAFHAMALAREACAAGRVPRGDVFAFTPTLDPVVHHEWGTGMLLYGAWQGLGLGALGLSAIRYALAAALLAVAYRVARLRGATPAGVLVSAPLAVLLVAPGMAPVRAQLLSLVLLGTLLWLLELDARGRRGWIPAWLALHVAWVNLHGGFVVGLGALGLTACERWARAGLRAGARDALRLAGVLAAALPLVLVNPWGGAYVAYLWRALRLHRPLIAEWAPLWDPQVDPSLLAAVLLALAVLAYVLWHVGPRRIEGLALALVTAAATAASQRHVSLFAVAWFVAVAPVLPRTPLGELVAAFWARRPRVVAGGALALAVLGVALTASRRAWDLGAPSDPGAGWRSYPVAAVDRLSRAGFEGRVLTAFEIGSYVTWRLHPRVRVSLDTRYEAAYQPGVAEAQLRIERAEPGWPSLLERWRPDAILVRAEAPVVTLLEASDAWRVAERDPRWVLLLRR